MMTRIGILSLLLVAVSGVADSSAQEKQKQAQAAVRTNTVYYREKGSTEWMLFGYYETKESAENVFEHLDRTGYEVELRITNTPIPKPEPIARKAVSVPQDEKVTLAKAKDVFQEMVKMEDLAFKYPTDGCYARAELMIERMQKLGVKPRKVWSVANGEELYAKTKHHPRGYVTWAYHVAPVLRVIDGAEERWYVIDPSLFQAPATLTAWRAAQMKTSKGGHEPFMTVSRPGEPPLWVDKKKRPGSGYWPGNDPKEGAHQHAIATMKKYKPFEGKAPPKKFSRLWPAPVSAERG